MATSEVINGGPYASYNDRKHDASVMTNMIDGILKMSGERSFRTAYPGSGYLDDGSFGEKYGKFEIKPMGNNVVSIHPGLFYNSSIAVGEAYSTGRSDTDLKKTFYGSGYLIPEEDRLYTLDVPTGDYATVYWFFIKTNAMPEDLLDRGTNTYGERSVKIIPIKSKTQVPANTTVRDDIIDTTNPRNNPGDYPECAEGEFHSIAALGIVIVRPSGIILDTDIMDSRQYGGFGEIATKPLPQIQSYIDLLKEYGTAGKVVRSKVLQNHNVWIDHLSSSDVGIATPNDSRVRLTDSQASDIHNIIAVVLSAAWPQSAWAPIYLARHGDKVETDDHGKYISAWLYSTSDGAPPWYIWPNIDQYYKCDFTVYYT